MYLQLDNSFLFKSKVIIFKNDLNSEKWNKCKVIYPRKGWTFTLQKIFLKKITKRDFYFNCAKPAEWTETGRETDIEMEMSSYMHPINIFEYSTYSNT